MSENRPARRVQVRKQAKKAPPSDTQELEGRVRDLENRLDIMTDSQSIDRDLLDLVATYASDVSTVLADIRQAAIIAATSVRSGSRARAMEEFYAHVSMALGTAEQARDQYARLAQERGGYQRPPSMPMGTSVFDEIGISDFEEGDVYVEDAELERMMGDTDDVEDLMDESDAEERRRQDILRGARVRLRPARRGSRGNND